MDEKKQAKPQTTEEQVIEIAIVFFLEIDRNFEPEAVNISRKTLLADSDDPESILLGIESIDVPTLIMRIEKKFEVRLPNQFEDQYERLSAKKNLSLGAIIDAVEAKLQGKLLDSQLALGQALLLEAQQPGPG